MDVGKVEPYRDYLRLLARLQVDSMCNHRIDLSGVVQKTIWEAAKSPQTPTSNGELLIWLRRLLANNLRDEIRKMKAERRDVRRERSLEAGLEASSVRLENWLKSQHSSPSHPEEGVRTHAARKTGWGLFLALSIVVIPGWTLYRLVKQRRFSLRVMLLLPLLAGWVVTLLMLPAPVAEFAKEYSISAARLIIAFSYAPVFVFAALLIRHARQGRWRLILMWGVAIVVIGSVIAIEHEIQRGLQLSLGETYSVSDWDFP